MVSVWMRGCMNGGRRLPEVHAAFAVSVLSFSPLSPTDHRGRERSVEALQPEKDPAALQRHAVVALPLLIASLH